MIRNIIKGRMPLIFINTLEIERCIRYLESELDAFKEDLRDVLGYEVEEMNIYRFTSEGIIDSNGRSMTREAEFLVALREVINNPDSYKGLFVFSGFHYFLEDDYSKGNVNLIIQDGIDLLRDKFRYIVFVGDMEKIPDEVKILGIEVEFNRPSQNEIVEFVNKNVEKWIKRKVKKESANKIANILSGLTLAEIENILRTMFIKTKGKKIDYDFLYQEKANLVKKTGLLEIIRTEDSVDNVGGLDNLKSWAEEVKYIYDNIDDAIKFGVDIPKGCLITGVSGCGKTLFAKAIANYIGVPLLRLDIGRLMGGLVGETERNTRELFKIIDSISPCVVLIDEIEKMMAGSKGSDRTDGGVVARMLGNFLYYMEERKNKALFIATANDIMNLPPELLRKGRWDEIWFVDIPSPDERLDIIRIHLEKRGHKFEHVFKSQSMIREFLMKSNRFSGAEIEQVVKDSIRVAFVNKKKLTAKIILETMSKVKPLVELRKSEYDYIKKWAANNCRKANKI